MEGKLNNAGSNCGTCFTFRKPFVGHVLVFPALALQMAKWLNWLMSVVKICRNGGTSTQVYCCKLLVTRISLTHKHMCLYLNQCNAIAVLVNVVLKQLKVQEKEFLN